MSELSLDASGQDSISFLRPCVYFRHFISGSVLDCIVQEVCFNDSDSLRVDMVEIKKQHKILTTTVQNVSKKVRKLELLLPFLKESSRPFKKLRSHNYTTFPRFGLRHGD